MNDDGEVKRFVVQTVIQPEGTFPLGKERSKSMTTADDIHVYPPEIRKSKEPNPLQRSLRIRNSQESGGRLILHFGFAFRP